MLDRALIQLGGTPAAGEYWVVTLTGTNTTLSVDGFLDAVFQGLGNGSLAEEIASLTATGGRVVFHAVTAGQTLTDVGADLRAQIAALGALVAALVQAIIAADPRFFPFGRIRHAAVFATLRPGPLRAARPARRKRARRPDETRGSSASSIASNSGPSRCRAMPQP